MKKIYIIHFVVLALLTGCSREYKVGKISVVDETSINAKVDIAQTAEELLKGMKNIGTTNPSNSNATLKINISETNSMKERGKGKNRYSVSITMTATLKDSRIEIFQSESTSVSEADIRNAEAQIKTIIYDALLKLDYQCSLRRVEEKRLVERFNDRKTPLWQKEAIIDEIGNRINTNRLENREAMFKFLVDNFSPKRREIGDKILGILSSTDINKFSLSDNQKDILSNELVRYSIGRETHIMIHTITLLSKIGNTSAKAFIFALSTGSPNKDVRNYAKEIYDEINKRDTINSTPITSK